MRTTLIGRITAIFAGEIVGNNFEKRRFRVKQTDAEPKPNHWEMECQQGDVNLLDGFHVGDEVVCTITITGREWMKGQTQMIFNTLRCVDIAYQGTASKPAPSTRQQTGGIPHQQPTAAKKQPDQQPQAEGWKKPNLPDIDF